MSYFTFLAADCPLLEVAQKDYPIEINIDEETGATTVYDGDMDDNYSLSKFHLEGVNYIDKKFAVYLSWNYYTVGRARNIIEYIKTVLQSCDSVEIWKVWLSGSEDMHPIFHRYEISIRNFTEEDIKKIDSQDTFDGKYNNKPNFYCLKITK